MAFGTKYKIAFTNELEQVIEVFLNKKDYEGDIVESYDAIAVNLTYNGEEGKYSTILGSSLEITVNILVGQTDFWDDFALAVMGDWQVIVTKDAEQYLFIGFVLPDEGGRAFQDQPYEAKISAVDGLGLLKESTLKKPDGTNFSTHHSVISYLAAIFNATGHQLPIRVYDDVYHSSMNDRADNAASDFVSQSFLEYRTFQENATTFYNNYECLERICKEEFRVFQYNGEWIVQRISLLQYQPSGAVRYGTLYNYLGGEPAGFSTTDNYATVGKTCMIYPINEDQIKYVKKAAGISKTIFNYDIWPEIPKNNKFERGQYVGTTLALDDSDIDGDNDFTESIGTCDNYTVADWEYGEFALTDYPDFTMNPAAVSRPLIRKVTNDYGLEIVREVAIPASTANISGTVSGIRSEAIPVVQGDRLKFGVDKRYAEDLSLGDSGFSGAAIIYLTPSDGGPTWYLINSYTDPNIDGIWTKNFLAFTFAAVITVRFGDTDTRRYTSVTLESQPMPVSGDVRVILYNPSSGDGNTMAFYRGFDFEYRPMVAGGFQNVKGDYFQTTNANAFPDKTEEEVNLADNLHKVFKGCLLNSQGVPFTQDFKRYGVDESKRYHQLTNTKKFNHEQRRYWFIEGSFTGITCAPENNQENIVPVGLHYQYKFVDLPESRIFMLGAPLEMDLVSGNCTMRFYEVTSDQNEDDGNVAGTQDFKYIF